MIDDELARRNAGADPASSAMKKESVRLYEVEENQEMQEQIRDIHNQL